MAIHDRIKKIRSEFFKSNLDFATTLGEKPNTTSNWISGTRKIGLEVVEKIASKLPNINLDWLLTGQGEMLKQNLENNNRNVHNEGSISGSVSTGDNHTSINGGVSVGNDSTSKLSDYEQEIILLKEKVLHLEEMLKEKERFIQVLLANK